MSTLVLVRHGQATPFEEVTDRLSPTGEAQSRKLGAYWARHRVAFDEVYSGPLARQRRTAELCGESYAAAGLAWPEVEEVAELNEYDAEGILTRLVPALAGRDAHFRGLVEAFERARGGPDRNRHFQRLFEVVTDLWLRGEVEAPGVEPWREFGARVRQGLRGVMQKGGGRRVAGFTSGGPIGVAVQTALAAPDRSALEVNWRVRNCSLTEFMFSRDRFTLDLFNATPHLDEPALWTFR